MKYLVTLLLLVCSMIYGSTNELMRTLYEMNDIQKSVFIVAYTKGKKYDLSLTLAAIAWQESDLGLNRINIYDGFKKPYGSFGPYHILLRSYISRHNINNKWITSRIAERLITDLNFSTDAAIEELLYWRNYWKHKGYKGNDLWKRTIASYNAGYKSIKSKRGRIYLNNIRLKILAIKKYLSDNK